jgi:hypothetical protein
MCPRCEREFGLIHQAHSCLPGISVADTFAGYPATWRAIYAGIIAHLETLGPVHEDAVRVGVFLKRRSKFAEIRPMARAVSLELVLPEPLVSARVMRQMRISSRRVMHVIRLTTVDDVDADLRALLTEAYLAAD